VLALSADSGESRVLEPDSPAARRIAAVAIAAIERAAARPEPPDGPRRPAANSRN
jgi:hypothetical protein